MLAISNEEDLKRFAVLDRLIEGGWSSTLQRMIPAEVLEAAENGWPIPVKGNDRDKALARTGPTPDEVILQRRLKENAASRAKYSRLKRRTKFEKHEAVRRQRAAAPAETATQEGNQECRI